MSTALDEPARGLWRIVRGEIAGGGVYTADAERSRAVLDRRRLRSAEFFAATAARWDEMRAEMFGSGSGLAPLLGLIDSGWVVGDLGVGTGSLSARLAPFARTVIGVDRSDEMLTAARARLAPLHNVDLRRGNLEALPIEDRELDLAILALVLHYVVDPSAVLAEVRRALKPGSRVLIVDMRLHDRGIAYREEMGHVWPGFEGERVEAWLSDLGFQSARFVELPPEPEATGPLLFLASAQA